MPDLSKITTYQSGVAQATAYRIVKAHTAEALREFNLSSMQWFTIGTVLDAGTAGIRLSDLAKRLDTTIAYMTSTVNMLESRGILLKTPHETDARTKLVSVNPDYVDTCEHIEQHVRQRLRELLYNKISREQLTTYVEVLALISTLK